MAWDTGVLRGKTASFLPPSHSLHRCCILQSITSALPQLPGLHCPLAAVTSCAFPGLLNFAAQIFAGPQASSFPESQIPRHPLLLAFFRLFGLIAGASLLVSSDARKSLWWSRASWHLPSPICFQEPRHIGSLSTLLPLPQAPLDPSSQPIVSLLC